VTVATQPAALSAPFQYDSGHGVVPQGWKGLLWPVRRFLLHAEPRASHGFDRCIRPAYLDMCRALPAEEVEHRVEEQIGHIAGV
jgi:hypothetical protein